MEKKKLALNNMELFQKVKVGNGMFMTKVPGGWIYTEYVDLVYMFSEFIHKSTEYGNKEYEVEDD